MRASTSACRCKRWERRWTGERKVSPDRTAARRWSMERMGLLRALTRKRGFTAIRTMAT